jgi:hypothetical protein
MELSEQIGAEYDKADALSGRCDISRDTLLGWKNEVTQLGAESETLKTKNKTFHNALSDIADTSPCWMQKDAVADSERRMRKIAQDALLTAEVLDRS